jgi:hypothetical protein
LRRSPASGTSSPGPHYAEIEGRLKGRIFELFDPAAVDEEVMASVGRRELIKRVMTLRGARWDFGPCFDPARGILDQYLPGQGLDEIPR